MGFSQSAACGFMNDSLGAGGRGNGFSLNGPLSTITPEQQVIINYATLSGATVAEKNAMLTLSDAWVTAGIWNKIVSAHPFVGSSLANKYFNMVNPGTQDGYFRLKNLSSLATNNTKGIQLAGASQKLITFVDPINIQDPANFGMAWYVQTPPQVSFLQLANSAGTKISNNVNLEPRWTGDTLAYMNLWANNPMTASLPVTGFSDVQRNGTTIEYLRNSTLTTRVQAINSLQSQQAYLTLTGSNINYVISMWISHLLLTSTERDALRDSVNTFMTTLGRNA